MPTYDIDLGKLGSFTVESKDELDDSQAIQLAMSQLVPAPAIELEQTRPGFFERSGRRLREAGAAFTDIPSSTTQLVTGGDRGRLEAGLRLLRGIFSPLEAAISPTVGAAVETAGAGVGLSESAAEAAGHLADLPLTMGIGLLAKAGKLGLLGLNVARALGVGRSASLAEQMRHDPLLEFAAGRARPVPTSLPEALARTQATTAQIKEAMQLSPESQVKALQLMGEGVDIFKLPRRPAGKLAPAETLDEVILNKWTGTRPAVEGGRDIPTGFEQMTAEEKAAHSAMQAGSPTSAAVMLEQAPGTSLKVGKNMEFQYKDIGLAKGYLATPGGIAAQPSTHPLARAALNEQLLFNVDINTGIRARMARSRSALANATDNELAAAVRLRETMPHAEAMNAPVAKVPVKVKQILEFLEKKADIDVNIIRPRLTAEATQHMRSVVERDMKKVAKQWGEEIDEATLNQKVKERVADMHIEKWGLKDYLSHIFPGFYKIRDKQGHILATADYQLEAKFKLNLLADQFHLKAADFVIDHRSFFDSEILRSFRGRVGRTLQDLAKDGDFALDDIEKAIRGDFGPKAKAKFFGSLLERTGKHLGYSRDLLQILDYYDSGIERWMQLSELSKRNVPVIKELAARGYPMLAEYVAKNLQQLWGFRHPLSAHFDNSLQSLPVINQLVAPYAMERWAGTARWLTVNSFLRFNPRYHMLNSTQLASTLGPIADVGDIAAGFKLWAAPETKALLDRHGIAGTLSRVERFAAGLGGPERMNQQVAFLTMYQKARNLGLDDLAAADYGKLRGNIYSQFLGLVADQPMGFRTIDPAGILTMFQRFPVKQLEQVLDLVKDKNFPGIAKFLTTYLALGGFRAATLGSAGWLTYDVYKRIEQEYGRGTADLFHIGLPSLLGIDMSSSVMLYNPPFGETWGARLSNMLSGPVLSTASSVVGAAMDQQGVEPSAAKRALSAVMQRVPIGRSIDGLVRVMTGDYNFKDPAGRLRFEGDFKDAARRVLGARVMKEVDLELFASAIREMRQRRDETLNFAATRYGQAAISGVDLGSEMQETIRKEVDRWNSMWPEFPITGSDILERAQARRQTAMLDLRARLLRQAPAAVRQGILAEGGG